MKNAVTITIVLVLLAGTINHLHAQEKSTVLAIGLSIGVPLVGCYTAYNWSPELFLFSFGVAPSIGHFYAEQWARGIMFVGIRTLIMAGTMSIAIQTYDLNDALAALLIGFCGCCTVTLIDWILVPSSVSTYNKQFQIEPRINLQNGSHGVGISYRF